MRQKQLNKARLYHEKIAVITSILLCSTVLVACVPRTTDQEQNNDLIIIQNSLPDNCKVSYAGKIRVAGESPYDPSRIFYTVCGDVTTTSESHEVQEGKYTRTENNVTITKH